MDFAISLIIMKLTLDEDDLRDCEEFVFENWC